MLKGGRLRHWPGGKVAPSPSPVALLHSAGRRAGESTFASNAAICLASVSLYHLLFPSHLLHRFVSSFSEEHPSLPRSLKAL